MGLISYPTIHSIKRTLSLKTLQFLQNFDHAIPPQQLSIEITDACNLHCPMCPRNFATVENKHLDVKQFKYILDRMPLLKRIAFVGRGETLMHPKLFDMMEYAKNKHFSLTTNGTLLNEKNVIKLKKFPNLSIVVSIDDPRPEKFFEIRGVDLGHIKENLKNLKRLNKNAILVIQSLIMGDTIEGMADLVEFANEVNANKIALIHIIGFDEKLEKLHGHNYENLNNELTKMSKLAKKNSIELRIPPLNPSRTACLDPWFSIRVALNGDIYPCCYIYNTSESIWKECYKNVCLDIPQDQYILGNIFNDSLNNIWNGIRYKKLRKIVRKCNHKSELSKEELNRKRVETDLSKKFLYCKVCLYKYGCAC